MVCSVMWYDSDNHYTWLVNNLCFSFYLGGSRPLTPQGVHTLFSSKWRLAVEVLQGVHSPYDLAVYGWLGS